MILGTSHARQQYQLNWVGRSEGNTSGKGAILSRIQENPLREKPVWSFDSFIKLVEKSHILLPRKATMKHVLHQLIESVINRKHAEISNI